MCFVETFKTAIGKRLKSEVYMEELYKNGVRFIRQQADEILDWINIGKGLETYASKIRVFLLLCIIVMWRIVHYKYGYTYAVAMNFILFLAFIAWIPMEKPMDNDKPLHPILRSGMVVCLFQFISDILLKKEFGYSEFICVWMFLCFGLLYRAWGRMQNPEKLLEDFVRTIEILFVMNVVYCLVGNARKARWTNAMTGTRLNPNPFAMGVALCLVILLFRLGQNIYKKKKWYCYLQHCVGMMAGIWMLVEAKGRNAWFIFGIAFCFLIFFLFRKYTKKLCVASGIFGIVILLAGIILFVMKANTFSGMNTMEIIDVLLTGRVTTWKAYISQIGLIGNTGLLKFEGVSLASHNGIIMLMYRYGFFAGIAGIVFLFYVIRTVLRAWKTEVMENSRNSENGIYVFLMVGILVAYLFPSMLDTCDEGIMGWINWFAFYFMIGYAVQEK